jgi:hypothetical protein
VKQNQQQQQQQQQRKQHTLAANATAHILTRGNTLSKSLDRMMEGTTNFSACRLRNLNAFDGTSYLWCVCFEG